MSKQPEAANLTNEKTKDIRMTNIIAAKGKSPHSCWNGHLTSFM